MPINFITVIEILGTFSFAAAGAFAAMERKMDPFGVLIISFATAIGGGTIRDILIGEFPVSWLSNTTAIWVILTATVATMLFGSYLKKLDKMLFLFDSIGLGLFTMIGIQKGLSHELGTGVCVMLGTVTGCFGGVLRDVLLNKIPLIFHKEIYASASIIGGVLFFVLIRIGSAENFAYIISILAVFAVRSLAVKYNWSLPNWYAAKTSNNEDLLNP
jgi:uncharacterized membrane protein YeiH